MKLHYSQTERIVLNVSMVSVPYEITLLSNIDVELEGLYGVSVPYEITLLSNPCSCCLCSH